MAKGRKLTDAMCERAKCARGATYTDFYDTLVPGLYLRVSQRGKKTWNFYYRVHGKQRRTPLGQYPDVPLDGDAVLQPGARQLADAIRLTVASGQDPERVHEEEGTAQQDPDTFGSVAAKFITLYRARHNTETTRKESESNLARLVLPHWENVPINSIRRKDVLALLDTLADDAHPYRAIHVFKDLRRLFGWAYERELIDTNPVQGVQTPPGATSRDRVLTDNEIVAVWDAFDQMGKPFGDLFKLLLLTGQRRDEVGQVRWEDIDLDAGLWTLPAANTKNGRAHTIPLSPQAVSILANLTPKDADDDAEQADPPLPTGFVFTTTKGKKFVSGFSKAKKRADKLAGVCDWRLHDLRRTCATGMARLGVQPVVLAAVLNHAPSSTQGITAVYNRHTYEDQKREALETWADWLGQHVA